MGPFAAGVILIVLHTVGGAEISVNPDKIVSMRDGEHEGQYVTKEVGCLINTNDGKRLAVTESCEEVRRLIGGIKP